MKKFQLERLVINIFSYFGYEKKQNEIDNKVNIWFSDLEFIPNEAIDFIFNGLKENDNIPKNLPKAIKAIYYVWENNNPSKLIYVKDNCPTCEQKGYLIFEKSGYNFLARCGHCQNWRNAFGENAAQILTTNQIMDLGGRLCINAQEKNR